MRSIIPVLLLFLSSVANAASLTWTVDIQFSDGGTGSGTFNYDADTNVYSNIDILVSGGTYIHWLTELETDHPDFNFDSVFPDHIIGSGAYTDQQAIFCNDYVYEPEWHDPCTKGLNLNITAPLTNNGGVISLNSDPQSWGTGIYDFPCCSSFPIMERTIISGSVSAVPVPAAVWLFGSALAGLGWMRRKQAV